MGGTPTIPSFVPARHAGDVVFRFTQADPPSSLYIQRDDVLVLQGASSSATGESFLLTARLLMAAPPGAPIGMTDPKEIAEYAASTPQAITTITLPLTFGAPGVHQIAQTALAEGYLLSLSVSCVNTASTGVSFARVAINRGPVLNTFINAGQLLAAGYVTSFAPLSWPASGVAAMPFGPGNLGAVALTTPGAGAEFTFTVPANRRFRVTALALQLATSATVANRTPVLIVTDASGQQGFASGNNAAQTAGTTLIYNFGASSPVATVLTASQLLAPLPDGLFMQAGAQIKTVTGGIQAGDQWTPLAMLAEQWLDQA